MILNKIFIKRPVTVAMLFTGLALLGIFAYSNIGVDLLPNISIPHLIIQTNYPNTNPEEVEKQITEPLETAISTVTGVTKIKSVSKEGISIISVQFHWGTDMKFALISLREKLDNVSMLLPIESERPVIIRSDPNASPIMNLLFSYKIKEWNNNIHIEKLIDLKEAARVLIKKRLEQIEGVGQAVIMGGFDKEFAVNLKPLKLASLDISIEEINSALKSANIIRLGGTIRDGLLRFSLRTSGEFQNIEDINNTVIKKFDNGISILIKDVADVSIQYKEREGFTRYNGKETVGILIYKESAANSVSVSKEIIKEINSFKKEFKDYDLEIVYDESNFIEDAISNVNQEIIFGGILAVLVLLFFLSNIKHIIIIGITIPASLSITILLLYLFGINFNIISLGGIAVGIGMLLDNAIIVIENNSRYRDLNYSNKEAVIKGTQEVLMPIIASTLTTVAVFVPLIFVKGIASELFRDQSLAIAISLISSIFVSIILVPMLDSRENFPNVKFDKLLIATNKIIDKAKEQYERLLRISLKNKLTVLLITFLLIIISIIAAIEMKKEFIPIGEENEFILDIEYPYNYSLKGNSEVTLQIEKKLMAIQNVQDIISNIGRVNEYDYLYKEETGTNKSSLIIRINSPHHYEKVRENIRKIIDNYYSIKYSFKVMKSAYSSVINPSENDVEIVIKNSNLKEGLITSHKILEKLKKANIDGIRDIHPGYENDIPEYKLTIDKEKSAYLGIKPEQIANEIALISKGSISTYFTEFDKKIGIKIAFPESEKNNLTKILSHSIKHNKNRIHLKDLIHYEMGYSFRNIRREDHTRTLNIYASVEEGKIDDVLSSLTKVISEIKLNPKEAIEISGVNEEIDRSFSALYYALIISVLFMFMILASEFESLLLPLIILFALPLALIGAILLLFFAGESLNIISIMGLIILVGIADNDAVVKVEFIHRKRLEGNSIEDSIISAGSDRFRPIVMNSLTVMFGLFPMMIGIGAGVQLRISMSLAIIGGLFTSTILTLIVIPILYYYADKYSHNLSRKKLLSIK
ncbi:MAG: efflux RND transporter permease subunit [Ignavibacteriaceae bacterium]|nr:efflux RND transporter permease subunit [Ignavibacteriaceae bacterium]